MATWKPVEMSDFPICDGNKITHLIKLVQLYLKYYIYTAVQMYCVTYCAVLCWLLALCCVTEL